MSETLARGFWQRLRQSFTYLDHANACKRCPHTKWNCTPTCAKASTKLAPTLFSDTVLANQLQRLFSCAHHPRTACEGVRALHVFDPRTAPTTHRRVSRFHGFNTSLVGPDGFFETIFRRARVARTRASRSEQQRRPSDSGLEGLTPDTAAAREVLVKCQPWVTHQARQQVGVASERALALLAQRGTGPQHAAVARPGQHAPCERRKRQQSKRRRSRLDRQSLRTEMLREPAAGSMCAAMR